MKTVKISKSDNGIRLDKFLFKVMSAPQGEVYRSLRKKKIKVNAKRVTNSALKLCGGDMVELYVSDELLNMAYFDCSKEDIIRTPKKYDLDIVYEDDNIIVMNKPSGMLSQSDTNKKSNTNESLEGKMREYLKSKGEYSPASAYVPSLCHRIDRNTAGLVIAAKNISAHRILAEKIKSKEIRKFYICEILGHMPDNQGEIEGYITKIGNNKVSFDKTRKTDLSKLSKLLYKVIDKTKDKSTVEVELITGRTHQIRASFAYMGCPLAGDVKYGAKQDGGSGFQSLVAYKLMFDFKSDAGDMEYLNGKEIKINNTQR